MLSALDQPAFEQHIRKIRTTLLADVRYDFGWDPDPRQSSWQARYINRELTLRQIRHTTRPQWYGIVFSSLLALASLIVAILALSRPPAGAG
jgi:hypothetical protein